MNFASYASHIFTVAAKMLEFLSIFAAASLDTLVSDPTHAFKFAMYEVNLLMIEDNALTYAFNKFIYDSNFALYYANSFDLSTSDALTLASNSLNKDTTFPNASDDT